MRGAFRSLRNYNYRVWAAGAAVSNVGTWMQRTAQDWLVLAELTHKSATALGIVMALQFGPHALMLPLSGFAADYLERRKLLMATQAIMGLLALGLGVLTRLGFVRLWHVYLFAFLLGCVSAFDSAARQTFVAELVGEEDLSNAVGLNSTSFTAARMIGPAVAGVLIASAAIIFLVVYNSTDSQLNGQVNRDAAWDYPDPKDAAAQIKDRFAFWHGVQITADATDGTPGPSPPSR